MRQPKSVVNLLLCTNFKVKYTESTELNCGFFVDILWGNKRGHKKCSTTYSS